MKHISNSTKSELREEYRNIRRSIIEPRSVIASNAVLDMFCKYVLHLYNGGKSRKISVYKDMDGEITVQPIVNYLEKNGYEILVPDTEEFCFKKLSPGSNDAMDDNKACIPDIVIAPAIAFDSQKNRLGFGRGWYDSVMSVMKARHNALYVVVAYEAQCNELLPVESHDIKADVIITEEIIRT